MTNDFSHIEKWRLSHRRWWVFMYSTWDFPYVGMNMNFSEGSEGSEVPNIWWIRRACLPKKVRIFYCGFRGCVRQKIHFFSLCSPTKNKLSVVSMRVKDSPKFADGRRLHQELIFFIKSTTPRHAQRLHHGARPSIALLLYTTHDHGQDHDHM